MDPLLPSNAIYNAMLEAIQSFEGHSEFRDALAALIKPSSSSSLWESVISQTGIAVGVDTTLHPQLIASLLFIHKASALLDNLHDNDLKVKSLQDNQVVNFAFALSFASIHNLSLTKLQKSPIANIQSEIAMTVIRMCNGQFAEPSAHDFTVTLESYESVVMQKTAAFSALCTKIPAMATELNPYYCSTLGKFGECIGLLYQIYNDYAGLKDRAHKISDIGYQWTWPTIYAWSVAPTKQRQTFSEAWLSKNRQEIYDLCIELGAISFLLGLADTYKTQALNALHLLKEEFDSSTLLYLIDRAFPPLSKV